MCLVAFALDQSSRFPFVLASNRDEFYDRPASRLAWWEPESGAPAILGGRDMSEGGTWLGMTALGRLGLVTNVRAPSKTDTKAPSRGHIVTQWLAGDTDMGRLWPRLAMGGYNGFNMIALDFAAGECFWINNARIYPERLQKGIFGLSNAALNTPWPKVIALKSQLKAAMSASDHADALATQLFTALADPTPAPDEALPHTGVGRDWERLLSPAFIKAPDVRYGTRSSTVIITERVNKRLVTHVFERTFTPNSSVALMRHIALKNWPPRHTMGQADVARLSATLPPHASRAEDAFESTEVQEQDNPVPSDDGPARKSRARTLIKKAPNAFRGE